MIIPSHLEAVAYEQWQDRLREAEQWRLMQMVQGQAVQKQKPLQRMSCWLGGRMVEWGLKLRGENLVPASAGVVTGTVAHHLSTKCS